MASLLRVAELPRTPDITVDNGSGAWARHRAKVLASGGEAGFHLAALAAARPLPSPHTPNESEEELTAKSAKESLMSMSESMPDLSNDTWSTMEEPDDWSQAAMQQFPPAVCAAVPSSSSNEEEDDDVADADDVLVETLTEADPEHAQQRRQQRRSHSPPVHRGDENRMRRDARDAREALSGDTFARLAATPVRTHCTDDRWPRSRAGARQERLVGRRLDPVLAWGYTPGKAGTRGAPASPSGSSTSSMSSGPSSPSHSDRGASAGAAAGRGGGGGLDQRDDGRSSLTKLYDERVAMALFAGDEALAMGRHDVSRRSPSDHKQSTPQRLLPRMFLTEIAA